MHVRPSGVTGLVLGIVPFLALGQAASSSDEDAFIQKHRYDPITVTWTRLDDYAVTRVFSHPVYRMAIVTKEGYGQGQYWNNLLAVRWGDDLVPIPRLSRDGDLSGLQALFRPDFKLTSDDVGETFQHALGLIYPTVQDDRWAEKFHHEGSQWTFVRGRPQNGVGGYWDLLVTVDGQGSITGIKGVRRTSTP